MILRSGASKIPTYIGKAVPGGCYRQVQETATVISSFCRHFGNSSSSSSTSCHLAYTWTGKVGHDHPNSRYIGHGQKSTTQQQFSRQRYFSSQAAAGGKKGDAETTEDSLASQDFVQSWLLVKDRLLGMKSGSLESRDWMEAQELLNVLRRHPEFTHIPQRVNFMFSILNRLCEEVKHLQGTEDKNHHSYKPKVALPLKGEILGNVLLAWRDFVISLVSKRNRMPSHKLYTLKTDKKDNKSNNNNINNNTPKMALGELDTASVLECMERYCQEGLFDPHVARYDTVLHTMKIVDDPQQVPNVAERLFESLLQKSNHNPWDVKYHPNKLVVEEMVDIWAQSGLPQAPKRVDVLIERLQRWYQLTKRDDMKPSSYLFCCAMEAHCRLNEPNAAFARIQQLKRNMEFRTRNDDDEHDRNNNNKDSSWLDDYVMVYSRVCNAFAQCRHPDAADTARAILNDMIQAYRNGNRKGRGDKETRRHSTKPNQHLFNAVLNAYGRSGRSEEAQSLVAYMEQLAQETGDPCFRPELITYNSLIWALARAGDTDGAQSVFSRLLWKTTTNDTSHASGHGSSLDHFSVEGILTAFAQSRDRNAAQKIIAIIQQLQKISLEQNIQGLVTVSSYNKLLGCYANQNTVEGAQQAQELFDWMENQQEAEHLRPDNKSWLNLIFAWCNAGKPDQAEKVLQLFCKQYRVDTDKTRRAAVDSRMFGSVIQAWAKYPHPEAATRAARVLESMDTLGVPPTVANYTSLINAWAASTKTDRAARRAEQVFCRMAKRWNDGDAFAKPDEMAFNALFTAIAQSSDPGAMEQAEFYWRQMKRFGVAANRFHYTTLMTGWAKQNRPDKVESLFQDMKTKGFQTRSTSLSPSEHSHSTRLQAWSRAGNPGMTSSALVEWITDWEARRIRDGPKTQAFNAVIQAWLRSNHPDAPVKAEAGLRQMHDFAASKRFDCHPDTFCFNSVISTYAKSDRPDAGEKALLLLNELKALAGGGANDLQPSLVTFTETILALIRSHTHRNNRATISELLVELQSKPTSFWNGFDSNYKKINKELQSSNLSQEDRDALIDDLNCVQSVVAQYQDSTNH